jgi:hypothetical protein
MLNINKPEAEAAPMRKVSKDTVPEEPGIKKPTTDEANTSLARSAKV